MSCLFTSFLLALESRPGCYELEKDVSERSSWEGAETRTGGVEIEDRDGIFKFKEWSTHTCTLLIHTHKQAKEGSEKKTKQSVHLRSSSCMPDRKERFP